MSETLPLLARKATMSDVHLKALVWGEAGTGKSRLALSFPAPIVADLEKSTRLYAAEFDFWVAEPTAKLRPAALVAGLVQQIEGGAYPDRRTLVIDPVTDYLDDLEQAIIKAEGYALADLAGFKRAQAYGKVNEGIRERMARLLALPMHVVFVARAKNLWEERPGKGMAVTGRQVDVKDIVPYLADLVLHLRREGRQVNAHVIKSRLSALPDVVPSATFADIERALAAGLPADDEAGALAAPAGA